MDERVRILDRLTQLDKQKGHSNGASYFRARAAETREHANNLRRFLLTVNQQGFESGPG